jgi:hypothetical protein
MACVAAQCLSASQALADRRSGKPYRFVKTDLNGFNGSEQISVNGRDP